MLVKRAFAFLAAMGAATCLAQVAGAMDLNTFSPAPQPQKPDWAGFYLRNNSSGGGSDSAPWTTMVPSTGFASAAAPATSVNSTFGYNSQTGNFVFGLEGSLAAANFDGRFTAPYLPGMTAGAWTPNMNWLGTVTGKVGYSFGQWLPYLKGGFATAEIGSPLQGAPVGAFTQSTQQLSGWTAGVGLEYQITPKLSLGLEYLYADFGNSGGSGAPGTLGGAPISGAPEVYSTALKSQSLLGRLNYKAGW